MKNKNRTKIGLAAFILLLGFVCGGIPVSAASEKILVTDNDGDNAISIGDEFCLGAECFYVISNDDSSVRALAKYNLSVGYDAYYVGDNPDFQGISYNSSGDYNWSAGAFYKLVYSHGYYYCNQTYDDASGSDSITLCFKPRDFEVVFTDYSDDTSIDAMSNDELDELEQSYYDMGGNCVFSYPDFRLAYCYGFKVPDDRTVKQSSLAVGAHGNNKGEPAFPEVGNYYFSNYLPIVDAENVIVSNSAYNYYDANNDFIHDAQNNSIYHYIDSYGSYLDERGYDVEDMKLMSYNDLAHVLSEINPDSIVFKDNGYDCDGEWIGDDNTGWECEGSPWVWKYSDDGGISSSSMLSYIPEEYSWLYSTTYWLDTAFWNDTTEEFNTGYSYQFFVDTLGDLCSVGGSFYCNAPQIGAGVRPMVTIAADDFELNRLDINGTVKWIDNNNSSRIRPNKSIIKLYRNGAMIDSVEVEKDEDEDLWRFSFVNLLKYDSNHELYKYTITQDDIAQYASGITNFDVVNEYAPGAINPDTAFINPVYYVGIIAAIGAGVGFVARRGRRG